MISRQLVAFNTATQSENKIHDDDTAQRFGFTGGLVPGVEVYGYLSWGPVRTWGTDWLTRGTLEARFTKPAYDGETVTVEFDEETGECRLRDPAGAVVSTGQASLPESAPEPPDPSRYPTGELLGEKPAAAPESLAAGRVLGSYVADFPDETAETYLDDVREELDLYADKGIAHPGWILRLANRVLVENVVLGPWIHVGSKVQNYGLVTKGAHLVARGTVGREYERSGHRFTELDLAVFADEVLVATITHTAIYLPRQVTEASADG